MKQNRTIHTRPSIDTSVEALRKISDAITSDIYLDDVLKLIVAVTAQVMHSTICSLLLVDPAKQELVVKASQSVSEAYNTKPNMKIGQGIAGTVALTRKPMQVADVRRSPHFLNRDIARKEGLCSLLCVPLCVRAKVIGVLNCYTSKPHRFTATEIALMKTVAGQAAIIIENSRLLVESQVIREELETRKMVERAKSILMREENCSEETAFNKIQRYSMNSRKPIREIAEAIITASAMKKAR